MSQKIDSTPEGFIDVYIGSKKLRAALVEEYGDWEKMLIGPSWIDPKDFGIRGRFKDSPEFSFFLLRNL